MSQIFNFMIDNEVIVKNPLARIKSLKEEKNEELMKELKEVYFNPILNKNNNKNVLDVYFKNDLNVSKSAKDLYLNRNSLINRLESISKEIGYNIQSFKIACIILFIINSR